MGGEGTHIGDPVALVAFVSYLIFMVLIGIFAAKFVSGSLGDFFLGGRRMKDYVVALSAVVSGRSAWLILGVSGLAYVRGVSAVWAVVGYILVELFLFLFVGKRLRRYTARRGDITLPDFFESRFKDNRHILRVVSAVIIVVFMVAYVSAQLTAGGKAFSSSFGLSPMEGLWLTAGIVLIYTMLGGFLAVSLTDVLQAIFMLIGLVVLPWVAIARFGGLERVIAQLGSADALMLDPWSVGLGGLVGFIGIGLGSPGNPHILVRYMSVENPAQLRRSALLGTVWNVLMAWGAILTGLVGRATYPAREILPSADTENLYTFLAASHFPPLFFGLTVAAVFAAIMSTADSQLLVASSGAVRDIYQRLFKQGSDLSGPEMVAISRVTVFVLVLLAIGLGVVAKGLIFWLVLFAWGGLGASFGPAVILSLFWSRITRWGVLAGFLSGTAVTVFWRLIPALKAITYELVPGFIVSALLVVGVSLLTAPPPEARLEIQLISPTYRFGRK
ncbi:MAG: sodium/proline symporter [bacterium]